MTQVTNTKPPAMVRFREVCERLGISTDAGYEQIKNGTFPVTLVKVGSIWKARRSELDAFISGDDDDAS